MSEVVDDRGRRRRLLGLLVVLGLLAAALSVGLREDPPALSGSTGPSAEQLAQLRDAASLEPCPAGLGPDLPQLVLPCLGGGPDVALAAQPPARPTVLNIWASWCRRCREEVPALADLAELGRGTVDVVGVLNTDTVESALTFAPVHGMRYPSLVDEDGLLLRAYRGGMPTTLFLDADGRVAHVERGAFADVAELQALVAEHLGVQL